MGTLIYVFAGWTIYAVIKHPYFANPMIYLPFILMGIDKIYKKEKPYVFIWSVAVAGLSNFYFFYMIGIFMVLYAIFRYFQQYSVRSLKNVGKWIGIFAVYSLIAVMIAAVILLPVILPVFGTDRFKVENYLPLLYDKIYYEKYLGCLIGENIGPLGSGRIFSNFNGRSVCVIFKEKKIYNTQSRLCPFEYISSCSVCRTCIEWIFLRVQQMDLGIWDVDFIHLCQNISGTFFTYIERKEKNLCDAAHLLWAGIASGSGTYAAKYDVNDPTGGIFVYVDFLWNDFYKKEKSDDFDGRFSGCGNHV